MKDSDSAEELNKYSKVKSAQMLRLCSAWILFQQFCKNCGILERYISSTFAKT